MAIKFIVFDFYNVLYFVGEKDLNSDIVSFIDNNTNKYRFGILTAINADLTNLLKKQNLQNKFEFVKTTAELGMSKTDPGIYQTVVSSLGLKPQQILFVDDLSENLAAAKEVGLVTLRYYKTKPLATQIAQLENL